VKKLKERMERAHEVAREHLQKATRKQKVDYDAKCFIHSSTAGDLVWYTTPTLDGHLAPKLRRSYMGPVVVVKKINDLNYIIQVNSQKVQKVVHHNKLLPYRGKEKPRWISVACRNLPK
jgi:hypothetical protein